MNNRGITLISLIITIIIILILAGVGIAISTSIIGNAKMAVFTSKMTQIEEALSFKLAEAQIDVLSGSVESVNILGEEIAAEELKDPDKYDPDLIKTIIIERLIENGEENPGEINVATLTSEDLENLFNIGGEIINDETYASIYDAKLGAIYKLEPVVINGEKKVGTGNKGILVGKKKITNNTTNPRIVITTGEYKKINGEYMCEPDLTGFNTSDTYYATFDTNGNTIMGNKIGRGEPTNWHNYSNQEWANIVVNNNNTAYFVWIPRYMYKITYYTDSAKTTLAGDQTTPTAYGDIDIKFVNTENKYIAPDSTETLEATLIENGYKLAEAFEFGDASIPGFWMSKYELSNARTLGEMKRATIIPNTTSIEVDIISNITNGNTEKNDVYLDGAKVHTGTLPYTINNLTPNKEYEVTVRAYLNDGKITNPYTRKVTTVARVEPNAPDFTGFVKETTYYVTFDGSGNPIKGNNINGEAPQNWYNYDEQNWANILVENNGKQAYFVWIPRYEYEKIPEGMTYTTTDGEYGIEINFIPTTQKTPSPGFLIPEAFIFGEDGEGQDLHIPGFWMSKYELSN